ncbi:ABC transporter substrate-binding protein [Planomonospora venezuelensis]|uniref:Multiple sugar transport system substrate-binding protein n=1 Tax=Planomonospora venezuelensis TaxID=1999 RepID=A0A841DJW2_PLAVE|nr:sugar ABC transporter substrate-binding protein [Planomonospora venezuelensis]MBB5967416.1 multiple sugar transport system substrate-binding protein [Planomonospora venezuelensis]GIN05492.1 sugar ABC transporter substrate-binding protein [Planomonospora venezuelensis]
MRVFRLGATALTIVMVSATLTACAGNEEETSGPGPVTLTYALWADNQLPAYKQCADAFTRKNPNIAINITQAAWDQYWQNLTTQIASGEAPDVFTDHVAYYPQFVVRNQILDIQPYVERDKVDLAQYQSGLADLWMRDGKRYGLPKDWDTMAIVYNQDILSKAKVKPAELQDISWNPEDGGDFEKLIARLTLDEQGHNGLDPAFDKSKIKVYGFLPEMNDGAHGQNGWGNFAHSAGFSYLDKNPWGSHYNYDDPRLAATVDWYGRLVDKGYAPKFDKQSTLGRDAVMEAGKGAMTITGSWMVTVYTDQKAKQKYAFAPLPVGPQGRKSAINGLSDAIYAGTEHKNEAWQWVKFLASTECQDLVAQNAVVFPAIKTSSDKALAAHQAAGRDVHVFVDEAKAANGTFILPMTDKANEIGEIVQNAMQSVWLDQTDAKTALSAANKQVNGLLS